MTEPIVLGYWGIRGRGQVPRLLLAYTGAKWSQKKYFSQDDWKGIGKDQASLNLPFPNLPYLIHEEFKITESKAIMHYIINISDKKELLGKDLKDEALIGNLVSVFTQVLSKCIELNFDVEHFESKRSEVEKFVEFRLQCLQNLNLSNEFTLGYLTLADFVISQVSNYIENIFPDLFAKYSALKNIRNAFQNVPEIKEYYEQQNAVKGPFLPPIGKVKF